MTDLQQQFPSLDAFGRQLDARAERDTRHTRPRRRRMRVGAAICALALAGGATTAVPATRAAVADALSALSGWVAGDEGAAPGRPVQAGERVPPWVAAEEGEKRVLAAAGGEKLVAIRDGERVTLALADYATSGTVQSLRRSLGDAHLMFVGPGRFIDARHDRRPLFGLVSGDVARVRFDYLDGGRPAVRTGLHGAFGVVIDTRRRPRALTAYDRSGRQIGTLDLTGPHGADFRFCPATGCLPWRR